MAEQFRDITALRAFVKDREEAKAAAVIKTPSPSYLLPKPNKKPTLDNLANTPAHIKYETQKNLEPVLNAILGVATAPLSVGLTLASYPSEVEGALLPKLYYHGSRADFKDFSPGLKFFTSEPSAAESYALGGGGNRAKTKLAGYYDHENDRFLELKPNTDGTELVVVTGKDKGKTLPADTEELQDLGIYPTEDWTKVPTGANIKQVALDLNKPIDATFKGYDRYGKTTPIKELAELEHRGNKWAQSVIEQAKKGSFDWSNTKYPAAQDAWRDILIPQLEKKGYDGIKYWDDGHDTVAVFNNSSIKDVPVFKPTESEKDTAVANILKFIKESLP